MNIKELAIETIRKLPENATWQEIQERIHFIAGVRKGFDEIDNGKGIAIEKVEQMLDSWTTK